MKKQRICFIFLFLICLLMPSVAMADLDVRIFAPPGGGSSYAISTIKSVTFITEVTGENWSPISGKTVTFSVSPDDGIVSLSTTSATTDSNGQAQTTVSLSGDSSETSYRFRATLDTGEWYWAPIFVWDGAELTLGVDGPDSYEAGESVRFTFRHRKHRVEDPAGRTVTFSVSPDDGTVSLSPTSATTDSNGEASTTLTTGSGSSGSYTVTASGGGHSISYTVTVETSSSPPPTDPNPDPPEVNSRSEVRQIPQEQRAAPEDSTAQPQQTAPESSTGNTPTQQAAPQTSTGNTQGTPRSVTTNTPADTTRTQTLDTPEQQASNLVVDALKVNKDVLNAGESFTISAVVRNQGEGSSETTGTLTYYQYFEDESVEKVGESDITSLAAGETTDVSITLTAPETSGTHSYYACVSTNCTSTVKISVRSELKELVISSGNNQTGTPNNDLPNPISVQVLGEDGRGVPRVKVVFRVVSGKARMRRAGGPKRWRGTSVWTDSEGYAKAYVTPADTKTIKIRASVVTATSLLDAYGLDPVVFTVNPDQAGGAPSARFPQSHVTALLANYPNPFNPETWIPYRLAKASEVVVEIFASNGQIVRRLQLGHQPAGIYQSRSRAAYWDGKNEYGEPVASGVYFYTLTAGDFTATRKMLIRK